MFTYKYVVPKTNLNTTYGSICIKNVVFEPGEIEKRLPDIVFDDENLKHMFAEENLSSFIRRNIYRRFIPKIPMGSDMNQFVVDSIRKNLSFYSFLAEGILGLIFRDLYNYQLAKGVIDISSTVNDSHTGVDACMYNVEKGVIVLGEAKFYGKFNDGIRQIIEDFIEKSIRNKLESLQSVAENCVEASKVVIKNLFSEEYDELTLDEFMNQKIIFCGFVLHSETNVSKYGNENFYDKYAISTQDLIDNISKSLNGTNINGDYEIIMVHLPIGDKKTLIAKIIETAQAKLRGMKSNI